jgi:hypothetical protein
MAFSPFCTDNHTPRFCLSTYRRLVPYKDRKALLSEPVTLGSVIFVSPLKSMNCTGLTTDLEKTLSNDFKRLGEK